MKKKIESGTEEFTMTCSKEEFLFQNAKSFDSAAKLALGDISPKPSYQHYCHLDRILEKIAQRRWYLTKCSSPELNDLRERCKFAGSTDVLNRTYMMSFGHCRAENVAMWGLYGKSDPLALRVTIPGSVLENWMRRIEVKIASGRNAEQAIKAMDVKGENGQRLPARCIRSSVFRDVLYASVDGEEECRTHGRKRPNKVTWGRVFYKLQEDESVLDGQYAGFMKDYEWWHEMESRLCVSLKRERAENCISIDIPQEVIAAMRFTFSPWLKPSCEAYVRQVLESALTEAGVKLNKSKFNHSVLQGALNFR